MSENHSARKVKYLNQIQDSAFDNERVVLGEIRCFSAIYYICQVYITYLIGRKQKSWIGALSIKYMNLFRKKILPKFPRPQADEQAWTDDRLASVEHRY